MVLNSYKNPLKEKINQVELMYKILDKEIIAGKKYTEKEINNILKKCNILKDYITLRVELLGKKYLARTNDCREYWKIIKE